MSKKEEVKVECPAYMFNVDFILKKFALFDEDKVDCQKTITFRMLPNLFLDINEDEYIEQVNCSKPVIKNCMLSLSDDQLKNDLRACILAYKSECNNATESIQIGCYKIDNINCCFKKLKEDFDKEFLKRQAANGGKVPINTPPTEQTISQLAQLTNPSTNKAAGSVYFSIHMTCFGPYKHKNNMSLDGFTSDQENEAKDESEFDEFMAQINGNSLIVRVPKNNPYLVTQVFDESNDKLKDALTIRGCNQQIDFQFPSNFMCCQCKQNYGKCNCNSALTDFQRRTSCAGKSYKNNGLLPAIRGNLKYPGRFENQAVKFNVFDHCSPADATDKYRVKPMKSRGVAMQINEKNLHRELEGLCPIQPGIKLCKKDCLDDTDVFTFKINRKRIAKNGKKNEIELELRTPRGPSLEVPKLETREVQVNENEFGEVTKKIAGKGKMETKSKQPVKGKKK